MFSRDKGSQLKEIIGQNNSENIVTIIEAVEKVENVKRVQRTKQRYDMPSINYKRIY
jgi:hypothetical protein